MTNDDFGLTLVRRPVNDDHDAFPANPEAVTFVGKPFPLEDAHEHFSRLRRWGFTFSTFRHEPLFLDGS